MQLLPSWIRQAALGLPFWVMEYEQATGARAWSKSFQLRIYTRRVQLSHWEAGAGKQSRAGLGGRAWSQGLQLGIYTRRVQLSHRGTGAGKCSRAGLGGRVWSKGFQLETAVLEGGGRWAVGGVADDKKGAAAPCLSSFVTADQLSCRLAG